MTTWGAVTAWRSAPLGQAADAIKADLARLEAARDLLETQGVPVSWTGLAVLSATYRRGALLARLQRHIDGKTTFQRALYATEPIVVEVERIVLDAQGEASAKQFSIDADGVVSDISPPQTFDSQAEADAWTRSRETAAEAIAAEVSRALGRAAAADATLAGGIPPGHVDEVDERGVPDPAVAERWATMTDDERRAAIEEMIEEQAAEAGIPTPDIVWEPESWGLNGQCREGGGEIALNSGLLDDPQVLNTVAHEMRHARQFEAIEDEEDGFNWPWEDDPFDMHEEDGISREQAREWARNFQDYQSTDNGDTYEEYYEQPVEVDARRSGREVLEDLTEEELTRLLEEGQR